MSVALVAIPLYGCATVGGDVTDLDAIWRERMLTEHYGTWHNSKEVFKPWEQRDAIHSFPDGASFTVYRIKMSTTNSWGNGEEHNGGLLARVPSHGVRVELFGKMFAPIRMGGISIERGEACDIFLVVRPAAGGYARLVMHWRLSTQKDRTVDEYGILLRNLFALEKIDAQKIRRVIVASVVPPLDPVVNETEECTCKLSSRFKNRGLIRFFGR